MSERINIKMLRQIKETCERCPTDCLICAAIRIGSCRKCREPVYEIVRYPDFAWFSCFCEQNRAVKRGV